MNKKISRLLSLMLVVLMCLSAVGCGNGKEADNTTSDIGEEIDMADLDDVKLRPGIPPSLLLCGLGGGRRWKPGFGSSGNTK